MGMSGKNVGLGSGVSSFGMTGGKSDLLILT